MLDVATRGEERYINVGESVHQGVETGFRLDSDQLFGTQYNYYLTTSYTYLDAYFSSNAPDADIVKDNRFPYAPEHLINANIGVEMPWDWIFVLVFKVSVSSLVIRKIPL